MKEKGIIFDAESVRQILEDAKTQSRRVIKPQPPNDCGRIFGPEWYEPAVIDKYGEMVPGKPIYGIYDEWGEWGIKCPYQPGDRLYVRETHWRTFLGGYDVDGEWRGKYNGKFYYYEEWETACHDEYGNNVSKRPAIHMPRWAARIWLEVTAVRVEQVQDISDKDVCAELGIPEKWPGPGPEPYRRQLDRCFAARWDTINRRRGFSWESNCWVFVYEFRRITP